MLLRDRSTLYKSVVVAASLAPMVLVVVSLIYLPGRVVVSGLQVFFLILGVCGLFSWLMNRNPRTPKADAFREKAAAGDADAMFQLGLVYDTGKGVVQDCCKAREWYEKAAAAGNARAMTSLGGLYDKGHGVPKDDAKARYWYEKAAAAGNDGAMRDSPTL